MLIGSMNDTFHSDYYIAVKCIVLWLKLCIVLLHFCAFS